ncbi:MAG TPA: hypothetical protein VNX00_12570, partial [Herbaspirillum sp.]|nr:hypothetical protein [Herbaspirillum sp.]
PDSLHFATSTKGHIERPVGARLFAKKKQEKQAKQSNRVERSAWRKNCMLLYEEMWNFRLEIKALSLHRTI